MNPDKKIEKSKKIQKLEKENINLRYQIEALKAELTRERRSSQKLQSLGDEIEEIRNRWNTAVEKLNIQREEYKKLNQELKEFRDNIAQGKIPKKKK